MEIMTKADFFKLFQKRTEERSICPTINDYQNNAILLLFDICRGQQQIINYLKNELQIMSTKMQDLYNTIDKIGD